MTCQTANLGSSGRLLLSIGVDDFCSDASTRPPCSLTSSAAGSATSATSGGTLASAPQRRTGVERRRLWHAHALLQSAMMCCVAAVNRRSSAAFGVACWRGDRRRASAGRHGCPKTRRCVLAIVPREWDADRQLYCWCGRRVHSRFGTTHKRRKRCSCGVARRQRGGVAAGCCGV